MFFGRWENSAFVAGHPILDFINTVDFQGQSRDANRLTSYDAVVAWCLVAGIITQHEACELTAMAAKAPILAEQMLDDLNQWRETVHRVCSALLIKEKASIEDWRIVEESIKGAIISASLKCNVSQGFQWFIISTSLMTISKRLALQLDDFLRGDLIGRLKKCDGCTWLFADTSKNYHRRWCAMGTCGNRAKALRYNQNSLARDSHD